jgi:hypothetical protein
MICKVINWHTRCICNCPEVDVIDVENTFTCLCFTRFHLFGGIIDQWMSILCAKPLNSLWHKRECSLGDWCDCGIQMLKICFQKLLYRHLMKWKSIGYEVVGQTKEGKDMKIPTMMYNETTFVNYVRYMQPHLKAFVLHTTIWHIGKMLNSNNNLTNCHHMSFWLVWISIKTTQWKSKIRIKICIGTTHI